MWPLKVAEHVQPCFGRAEEPACAVFKGRWSLAPASLAAGSGVHMSVTRSHTTAVLQHQETLSTLELTRQGREQHPGRLHLGQKLKCFHAW